MAAAPSAASKSNLAKDGTSITSSHWPLGAQTTHAIFKFSAKHVIQTKRKPTSQRPPSQSAGNCVISARHGANAPSLVVATPPSRKQLMAKLSGDHSEPLNNWLAPWLTSVKDPYREYSNTILQCLETIWSGALPRHVLLRNDLIVRMAGSNPE
jgi:hypothetical protein